MYVGFCADIDTGQWRMEETEVAHRLEGRSLTRVSVCPLHSELQRLAVDRPNQAFARSVVPELLNAVSGRRARRTVGGRYKWGSDGYVQ